MNSKVQVLKSILLKPSCSFSILVILIKNVVFHHLVHNLQEDLVVQAFIDDDEGKRGPFSMCLVLIKLVAPRTTYWHLTSV